MMSYDPTRPAFLSGQWTTLTDNAGDVFLAILTNGKVTKDGVGPHVDLLAEFPYLGPPHNISVPKPCNFAYRNRASQGVQAPGLFMKEVVMTDSRNCCTPPKAHTTGGRPAMSRQLRRPPEVRLSRRQPGTGTNPEQLFAAGWSACFPSRRWSSPRANMKITLPAITRSTPRSISVPEGGAFSLAARLT